MLKSGEKMTLDQLKSECNGCQKCELAKTRTNVVFGVGNEHAKVMFVGEGPGENEDLKGEPFAGRAAFRQISYGNRPRPNQGIHCQYG